MRRSTGITLVAVAAALWGLDAWIRQPQGIVQLPSYVDLVVHHLEFTNPSTFVHQKFCHDVLR